MSPSTATAAATAGASLKTLVLVTASLLGTIEAVGIVLHLTCYEVCLAPKEETATSSSEAASTVDGNLCMVNVQAQAFSGIVARMIK